MTSDIILPYFMTEIKLLLLPGVILEERSIPLEHLKRNDYQIKFSLYIYTNVCIHHRDGISHLNIREQDYINDKRALKWTLLPRYLTNVSEFCSLWASLRGIINDGEYFKGPLPSVNHLISSNSFGFYSATYFNGRNCRQVNILQCGSFNITRQYVSFY